MFHYDTMAVTTMAKRTITPMHHDHLQAEYMSVAVTQVKAGEVEMSLTIALRRLEVCRKLEKKN